MGYIEPLDDINSEPEFENMMIGNVITPSWMAAIEKGYKEQALEVCVVWVGVCVCVYVCVCVRFHVYIYVYVYVYMYVCLDIYINRLKRATMSRCLRYVWCVWVWVCVCRYIYI